MVDKSKAKQVVSILTNPKLSSSQKQTQVTNVIKQPTTTSTTSTAKTTTSTTSSSGMKRISHRGFPTPPQIKIHLKEEEKDKILVDTYKTKALIQHGYKPNDPDYATIYTDIAEQKQSMKTDYQKSFLEYKQTLFTQLRQYVMVKESDLSLIHISEPTRPY